MHRIRVYVDTSVFGGTQDEEFAEASNRFFERVKNGEFVVLVSETTYRELTNAPEEVRRVLAALPNECVEELFVEDDAESLAEAYVSAGVLARGAEDDARHVATATVAKADLILSWNFRHIVNYDLIRKFNAVNLLNGYKPLDVHSPLEVEYGGENKNV